MCFKPIGGGMSTILINFAGERRSREWLEAHPEAAQRLLARQHTHGPAQCMCRSPALPLYVSRRGSRYYLARWPGTGPQHAPDCPEYVDQTPSRARVQQSGAVQQREDGALNVRVSLPLRSQRGAAPVPRAEPLAHKTPTASSESHRLSMQGLLELLWDQAEFNRWYPRMMGHRGYYQFFKYMRLAAERIRIGRDEVNLADLLYIPEPFKQSEREEIQARMQERIAHLSANPDRPRFLILALVRAFVRSQHGHGIKLRHAPGELVLWMGLSLAKRYAARFNPHFRWPDADNQLAVLALAERDTRGQLLIDQAASLRLTPEFIPIYNDAELHGANRLISDGRSFIKTLPFDDPTAQDAPFLLTDRGPSPVPWPSPA